MLEVMNACQIALFSRDVQVNVIWWISKKYKVLLIDLLDEPLHGISAEQVKTVYLQKLDRATTQLNGAMCILRSIWNWAPTKYDDSDLFIRNPVCRAMKQLGVTVGPTAELVG